MKKKDFYLFDIEETYRVKLTNRAEIKSHFLSRHFYDLDKEGNITALNLDYSNISSLDALKPLVKLKTLSLRGNTIADISALSALRNLQMLDIAENGIAEVFPLKLLTKLSSLNIEKNSVEDLTPLYHSLKKGNLTALVSANNPLQFPDVSVARGGAGSIVRWFDEILIRASEKIAANLLTREPELDLGRCGLTDLSLLPALKMCRHVKKLILSNEWAEYVNGQWERKVSSNEGLPNNISSLPPWLKELKNLKVLICGGDWHSKNQKRWNRWRIKSMGFLSAFLELEYLNLSNNQIEGVVRLPDLPKLERLHLNNNRITALRLKKKNPKLKELYLSNNEIMDISILKSFPTIETADFHSNEISDLASIVSCLERQPVEDTKWTKGVIGVAGNPLKNPEMTIVAQGIKSVLAWFRRNQTEKRVGVQTVTVRDIKLILVGNPTVGKSTLARYLQTGKVAANLASTHWMDVQSWTAIEEGKAFNVRIFDFGGQEYYHDTHHLFFTDGTAYVLLWDKFTNQFGEIVMKPTQGAASVENTPIQGYPIKYWLDSIRYHTSRRATTFDEQRILTILRERDREMMESLTQEEAPVQQEKGVGSEIVEIFQRYPFVLLAQNKVDEPGSAALLDAGMIGENYYLIFDSVAMSLRRERGLRHFKELLFEQFDSILDLDRETSATWEAVKERILELQKGEAPEMTLSDFREFCNEVVAAMPEAKELRPKYVVTLLFSDEEAFLFAQYLSNVGILLFFPHIPVLRDRVFLNQNKIRKNVYDILLGLGQEKGEFTAAYVASKLQKPAPDEECTVLLELMRDFKIIFPHPTLAGTYIAPLYLPKNPPAAVGLFLKSFQKPSYRFSFTGYIHKHVVLEFFQEYGKDLLKGDALTDTAYYWRDGLVLSDPNSHEIVVVKFANGCQASSGAYIDLYAFQGNAASAFLEQIAAGIEKITRYMEVEKEVTLDGEHFIPLFELEKAAKEQSWMFRYKNKNYELVDFKKFLKLPGQMKKVFISYSKSDTEYLIQLEKHLTVLKRNGTISTWNCRKLEAGDVWDNKIKQELEEANVILFLVSSDFLATEYIWDIEIVRAIERYKAHPDQLRIIPIILRACYWEDSPLGIFNTAPGKAKVIASSGDIDKAFKEAVMAIKGVTE